MRNVEDRLRWFLNNRPLDVGMCANHVARALDVPFIGAADATEAYEIMKAKGRINTTSPVPPGAMLFWTGGAKDHGHVAFRHPNSPTGESLSASTDVNGPRTTGVVPFSWFAKNWPGLTYKGWSWYWGDTNTEPEKPVVNDYLSLKETTPRKIRTNQDIKIDIAGKTRWVAEIPSGRHNLALYVNLNLPPALVSGKPNPQRRYLNNGGVRYWFQQEDLAEADKRDETGLVGPLSPPKFGDQYFLMSHDWAHVVDKDFWEFCFRVYAFDDNGKEVDIELELRTREIKIIGDKT